MTSTRIRWALALGLGVGACAEDDGLPDLRTYRTDRTVLSAQADYPEVCAGDLREVDEQVARVEEAFGLSPREPIQIYWIDIEYHRCGNPEFLACYRRSPTSDEIFTIWSALNHELVHAVTRDTEFPSQFWNEGTAQMLSGELTFYDDRYVLRAEDLQDNDLFTYITASHFCRFLVETYGMETFVRAARGEPLLDVFGVDADELAARYEREVPYSYPPLRPCPFPELPEVAPGQWSETLEFSCDSPEATQFEHVTWTDDDDAAVFRRVTVPAGTYALELQGGRRVLVEGCMTEPLDEEPTPEFGNGDVHNESQRFGLVDFDADHEHILELTAGTYKVGIASGTLDSARMTVHLRRLDD